MHAKKIIFLILHGNLGSSTSFCSSRLAPSEKIDPVSRGAILSEKSYRDQTRQFHGHTTHLLESLRPAKKSKNPSSFG